MGLNLSSVNTRPYISKDGRTNVKPKQEEEKSSSPEREQEQNEGARSKGLQYVETSVDTYMPSQVQTGWQAAKSQIQAQQMMNGSVYSAKVSTGGAENYTGSTDINIAQIIKDFKNTALAIGTPEELQGEVNGYLELIYSQIRKDNPNTKLIKSNFKNASTILDNYISETLNKESKVVENWVDAIFLQKIDFKYNEDDVNPQFLVKFPEKTLNQENTKDAEIVSEPEPVKEEKRVIDPELKKMFIDSKKLARANKPKEALLNYQKTLLKAEELGENSIKSKIYFEVGNIYNDNDYIPQALTSYNKSLENATENAVKIKAHYSMAKIYDEVNEISPALDHYYSSAAYAGEDNNIEAQTVSLTKMGNIYTDMYEQEAYDFYNGAQLLADETDNNKIKGFVASNRANSYKKFGEPQEALKEYSLAVKHYSQTDSPLQIARSYNSAADLMLEYHNINKAKSLLQKGLSYAEKTNDTALLAEVKEKLEVIS